MATAVQEDALRKLFSDRKITMETLLEIENKERQLIPMKLNPIQTDIIQHSSLRDIYVKPGQVGFTACVAGDFIIDNITINGTVSVIISYDEFSAKRLLMKAKKYHQSLERKIPSIPKLDHKSASELSFVDKATGFYSTFYIFSSQSYMLGRGETIHNLLLDEYAFWPIGTHELVFASAVQRVPLKAGTKIRIGSTANGEDNPFCEMYCTAKEGQRIGAGGIESVYRPHFYPWFFHPEYVMYVDDPFCLTADAVDPLPNLDAEEQLLMKKFISDFNWGTKLSMAKLRWRRYKQAEMKSLQRTGATIFMFNQEYPEDDESCFITAGNQAYSTDIISQKLRTCYPAPITRPFINKKTGVSVDAQIWRDVEKGLPYVMSIDPGKGKASESVGHIWHFEDGFTDKDNNDIPPVLRHDATLSGWYDEWEMAEYCKEFGKYYNDAVACPEDNLDIVSHLRGYPSLYYREDVRSGKSVRSVGWQTNTSTKPYMLTELNRHMEDIECNDDRFWSQCKNIRRDPTKKYGISVVGADDHHDAGVIAVCCRFAQSVAIGYAGNTGDDGGWDDDWGK